MVSHTVCTSSEGAEKYFANHLRTGDYFAREEPGRFHGKLAEKLGVGGQEITEASFRAFVNGDVPSLSGDETLKRPRQSAVKYQEFTYTAPKGFSVAAACDDRLKGELMAAVREEMSWLESFAAVRDRRGDLVSTETTRQTGNMIAALFAHETSRTNDPNFHIHGLIGNLSFDKERGSVLALHFGELMALRKTLDARIHNNLAARCAALGYSVEVAEHGFALGEVSREVMELFSQRGRQVAVAKELLRSGYSVAQIEAAAARLGNRRGEVFLDEARLRKELAAIVPANQGKRLDANTIDAEAVLLTRPSKEQMAPETLRANVAERLAAAGLAVNVPTGRPVHSPALLGVERAELVARVIDQAAAQVFERESVVRIDQLVGEAVRLAPGVVSNAEMMGAIRDDARFVIGRLSGRQMITSREIIAEERELLALVAAGLGAAKPLVPRERYFVPEALNGSPAKLEEMLAKASAIGEELTRDQAETWHRQFQEIHRYVSTSTDQVLNIRGGAGVGKTFALELLVEESLKAGRHVILTAPYGEQARVTMRAEADRLAKDGKAGVAAAFREANTVDSLLMRARNPQFSLRGADIYVDEAGLLDTTKALALARLGYEHGARLIFQGDTEQMAAVGRGTPIRLLQERLKLGMEVERASISRRQLKAEDKQLAVDLSSGDGERFNAALEKLIKRGDVTEIAAGSDELVNNAATKIVASRSENRDQLVVSSVHRLAWAISDRVHEMRIEANPELDRAQIVSLKSKDLAPAELLSSQFYAPGEVVEFSRPSGKTVQAEVVSATAEVLKLRFNGRLETVAYDKVSDVFTRSSIERAVGAKFLLTAKMTEGKKVWENKSTQTLKSIEGDMLIFASGLKLHRNDGRLAQGDVLTAYKAQGAKASKVLVVEDNRSLSAMANREAMHVLFTRHVESVEMLVESHDVLRETAQRTQIKVGALDFAEAAAAAVSATRPAPPPLPSSVLVEEAAQVEGTALHQQMRDSPGNWIDATSLDDALTAQSMSSHAPEVAPNTHFQNNPAMPEETQNLDKSMAPEEKLRMYEEHLEALDRAGMDEEKETFVAENAAEIQSLRTNLFPEVYGYEETDISGAIFQSNLEPVPLDEQPEQPSIDHTR